MLSIILSPSSRRIKAERLYLFISIFKVKQSSTSHSLTNWRSLKFYFEYFEFELDMIGVVSSAKTIKFVIVADTGRSRIIVALELTHELHLLLLLLFVIYVHLRLHCFRFVNCNSVTPIPVRSFLWSNHTSLEVLHTAFGLTRYCPKLTMLLKFCETDSTTAAEFSFKSYLITNKNYFPSIITLFSVKSTR